MTRQEASSFQALSANGGDQIRRVVLRVVLAYVVFAGLWITFSDQWVIAIFSDPQRIALVSTLKGYLFIALTAALLAVLLYRSLKAHADESRKLQILMQLASDGIQILDLKGNVVQVNEEFCRMLGYPADEIAAMNVCDWEPGVTQAQTEQKFAHLAATGELATFETRHCRRDGRLLDVEVSAAAVDMGGRALIYCVIHDITQRKLAEQKVRDSEARFRHMFTNSIDGILLGTPDGKVYDANPAACRMLGRPVEEIVSGGRDLITVPGDPVIAEASRQRQESAVFHGEINFVRKDGTRFPAEVASVLFPGAGGRTEVSVTLRDITERKRTEETLRAYTAQLNAYFRYGPVIAYRLDFNAGGPTPVWVSDNVVDLLGYSSAEVLVPGWWKSHLHPDDLQAALAASSRIFNDGAVVHEYRFARKDGSFVTICDELRLVHDGDHGKPQAMGSWSDVTERVNREAEIRKLSMALEQSPQSIAITNLDAEIEYVNDAFLRVTGYARDEVIGRNPRILQSGKTPPALYREMWAALLRGDTWEGEFINRRKDGSEYIEAVKMAPVRQQDGRITHYLAIKDDITDQKHMMEELTRYRSQLEDLVRIRTAELAAATQQADAANVAKSMFLANMSHEIRTPMNAITGLSYLLLQSPLSDEQRDRLQKIDMSSRHLRMLLDDILDLSKIEAGKMVIERVPFDLKAAVAEAFEIAGGRARTKGVPLTVEIDERLPAWVAGDALRLRQILLNLGSNAAKFTEQGSIAFRAQLESPLRVRFEFQDTGIGINEADQQRLFQPFQQADASTTRRYGGSGLGLAISRRLVDLMGGTIGVNSREGEGSLFWVSLPLQPVDEQVVATAPAGIEPGTTAARRHPLRLLLVEDDIVNQEVARELLSSVGHQVDIAVNGAEALRCASQARYDIVLMDMQMPVMDGLTATTMMRKMPGYSGTPIIAMTGNAFAEDRQRCLDAGMSDFIAKPVNPSVLYERINTWSARSVAGADASDVQSPPDAIVKSDTTNAGVAAHVARDEAAIVRRIAQIDDLDVKAGFATFAGFAVQEKLLRMYIEHHAADCEKMRQLLREEKLEDATRLAHTLKGGAAVIGAIGVRAGAERLEHAMREGESRLLVLEPEISALESANSRLVAALQDALGT